MLGMSGVPVRRQRTPVSGVTGTDLKRARAAAGLSLKELALATGVSDRALGSWERGERVPSAVKVGPVLAYFAEQGIDVAGAPPAVPGVVRAILDDPLLPRRKKEQMIADYYDELGKPTEQ